jgi:uncharacterized protein YcgL (UPF0745 family)
LIAKKKYIYIYIKERKIASQVPSFARFISKELNNIYKKVSRFLFLKVVEEELSLSLIGSNFLSITSQDDTNLYLSNHNQVSKVQHINK